MIVEWHGGLTVLPVFTTLTDEDGLLKTIKVMEGKTYKFPPVTYEIKAQGEK